MLIHAHPHFPHHTRTTTHAHTNKCTQNRTLNLTLEREKQKVARLEQALSQATQGKDGHVVQVGLAAPCSMGVCSRQGASGSACN